MTLPACPRVPVPFVASILPPKFIADLEQNQQIAHCCRHPENHEIEALRSKETEAAPDIYIFHCTCGRVHRRFMCGQGGVRPFWERR